jgi:hypothetical protein
MIKRLIEWMISVFEPVEPPKPIVRRKPTLKKPAVKKTVAKKTPIKVKK